MPLSSLCTDKSNMSQHQQGKFYALQNLSQNKQIIQKSDKGNSTFTVDWDKYI